MNTQHLLTLLKERGIRLYVEGEKLRFNAPPGMMTGELLTALKERRSEILALLRPVAGPATVATAGAGERTGDATRIRPCRRDMEIPLSFPQERIWFLDELHPGLQAYNFGIGLRYKGELDTEALERSLNEIVRRHEICRTTFFASEGKLFQKIHPFAPMKLAVADISGCGECEREETAGRTMDEVFDHHFDLCRLPLITWKVLRLDNEEHILVHHEHHIIHDGWSFNVFLGELKALYNAFAAGMGSPLDEPEIQFADFAVWQRQWSRGTAAQEQLAYWKEQLNGYDQVVDLPFDRPRPAVQSFAGRTHRVELPSDLCEAVRSFARKNGVSLYIAMLSVFFTLLHRYTEKTDICIGTGIANRRLPETERLLGMIINTLPFRADLSGNPSFLQLIERVREVCLGGYEHQDIPFDRIVEALQPERSLSYSPFYQTMFSFHDAHQTELAFTGLETTILGGLSRSAKCDLSVIVIPEAEQNLVRSVGKGIILLWEYNTDLFDLDTVQRMTGHFHTLLAAAIDDPFRPLSELTLLTEAERQRTVVRWNDTAFKFPNLLNVQEAFEKHARRFPGQEAVVSGNDKLTYGELNRKANRLAHHLRQLGVGPDKIVAICVDRSPEMIAAMLAVLKAGGAYLPLDTAHPPERLAMVLNDARPVALITQSSLASRLTASDSRRLFCVDGPWPDMPETDPEAVATGHHLAYVMYTSGSTGVPKGVMIEHRSLANLAWWHNGVYALEPQDRTSQLANPAFDASAWEVWPTLAAGATLCMVGDDLRLSPRDLIGWLDRERIKVCFMPTPLAEEALKETWPEQTTLKYLLTGGDRLKRRPAARHPFCLVNHYGPTEAAVLATQHIVAPGDDRDALPPIGRPIANARVYILDHHLKPAPIGVGGELYIGGAGVARGYLNRPELTSERFLCDPFDSEPGGRLYRTGDLARYLPDGDIEFLGRTDHQVKINGIRIEPGEIEGVLARHPQIRETAVIVREEPPGEKRLVAYLVSDAETPPTVSELRRFLAQKVPDFMIPSAFVPLKNLPLTCNGKLDRTLLPAPGDTRPELEVSYMAPYNSLQKMLAVIWQDLFNMRQIGIRDNFFELGGHSMLAITMVARIESSLGLKLPLATLFRHTTILSLAEELLELNGRTNVSSMVEVQAGATKPPFFFMHGDFHGGGLYCHKLARLMGPEQPFFVLQPHGLPSHKSPSTIEAMAADYLREIRSVFPLGPYYLSGHCNGALVALEMAQQLKKAGREVAKLVMVSPPSARQTLFGDIPLLEGLDLNSMGTVHRHNTLMKVYEDICARYERAAYQGETVIVVDRHGNDNKPFLAGWEHLIPQAKVSVVSGSHITMLTDHAAHLAAELARCLAEGERLPADASLASEPA